MKKILKKAPYKVKTGRNIFVKQKSFHKNIKSSSHLLPCKLPRQFVSWTSTKTISNCIVFFAVPNIVETAMEALPLQIYLFS